MLLSFPANAADPVRFGVSPHPDSLLPLIGSDQNKGWYKAQGVDVAFTTMRWRDIPDAVATGKVDVAISDLAVVIANHEKHPDLVYWYGLSTQDDGYALMIRPGGPFKTVDQLDGKLHDRTEAIQIAVEQMKGRAIFATTNTEMEQAVSIIARNAGLRFSKTGYSDVKTIDMRPDDGLNAFLGGQGDAYMAPLLQRLMAEKAGMVEMLSGADLGAAPIVGLVTTRAYANAHKEDMLKILHVWFRTVNFVQTHEHDASQIVAGEMGKAGVHAFTAAQFETSWQTMEHYPLSAKEAANNILDPDGPNYWQNRQKECSQYFCSVAEVLPEPVEGDSEFLMSQVQRDYMAKYGSTAGN